MAIFEYIEEKIPGWTRLNPYLHWRDLFLTLALVTDAEIEGVQEGRSASFPGQVDLPNFGGYENLDALPLIGRDRGITRGPTEPTVNYAARLRAWRNTWKSAGTAKSILGQLQGALQPNPPVVRLVTSGGLWYTLDPDGAYKYQNTTGTGFQIAANGVVTPDTNIAHGWNWDGVFGNPYRLWAILYAPTNPPLNGTEGTCGDGLSIYAPSPLTIGTTATFGYVELIRSAINNWKPAGITLDHIIVAFDPSSFDPLAGAMAPGYPDGTWGNEGKIITVAGAQQRVSARNITARYWTGTA